MKKKMAAVIIGMMLLWPLISNVSAQWFLFQNPLVGKEYKDFSLLNLSGEEKTLSVLREGKATIVFFWATWCPHCRSNLEKLNTNADQISARDINVVLVDLNENRDAVKKYLDRNKIDFDCLLDQDGKAADLYSVQGIPTFVYIAANGIVKSVQHELVDDYEKVF